LDTLPGAPYQGDYADFVTIIIIFGADANIPVFGGAPCRKSKERSQATMPARIAAVSLPGITEVYFQT
jgi:hypothetical protein